MFKGVPRFCCDAECSYSECHVAVALSAEDLTNYSF